jgi:hypothetical protein
MQALGLSSYPYLAGVTDPGDLPLNYYASVPGDASLPVMFIEGGWPSSSLQGVESSPDEQRRYIVRQAEMLDNARAEAWFQLTFTDLDTSAFPAGIVPFARLGLVDGTLQPKPALQAWDAAFARPLQRR